mmetsp:Transcript_99234/g.309258  ORF Transcript_99234/g.309258 Transcript_99234/m.309258 type:complete len:257 (+) Transcript_99234:151-921(+)
MRRMERRERMHRPSSNARSRPRCTALSSLTEQWRRCAKGPASSRSSGPGEACTWRTCLSWWSAFSSICVPLHLVTDEAKGAEPSNGLNTWVRVVAFALTLYLFSTFSCSLDRITGKMVLAYYIPGWRWILCLGCLVLYASIVLTIGATFVLFKQAPATSDLLLNCVALNFIAEVDVALVGFLRCMGFGHLGVSVHRLGSLAESWTETSARGHLKQYMALPPTGRLRASPLLTCQSALNHLFSFGLLTSAVYITYAI